MRNPGVAKMLLLFMAAAVALLAATAEAFNITTILDRYPDYSQQNALLTSSGVAAEINSRQTETVLVVKNGAFSALTSRNPSAGLAANILRLHVLLDYYDQSRLTNLLNRTTIVTTLFQTTGSSPGRTGFINITDLSAGVVGFGTPGTGAADMATKVRLVYRNPYNVSVIEISRLILPDSIFTSASSPPPPPPESPPPATAAAPSPKSALEPGSRSLAAPPPEAKGVPEPAQAPAPPPNGEAAPPPHTTEASPPPESVVAVPPTSSGTPIQAPGPAPTTAASGASAVTIGLSTLAAAAVGAALVLS